MVLYAGDLNEGSSVLDGGKSKLNELKEGKNPKQNHSLQKLNQWVMEKRELLVNQKWEKLRGF